VTTDPCENCGTRVRVAGGIGDMWNPPAPTGGLTVEFETGGEAFLCFACLEKLPDEPTQADVDELDGGDASDGDDGPDGDDVPDGDDARED
jgi:hypothetical protein